MKGIVFTEFLEMLEERFSAELVEDVYDNVHLPSGGGYTAVGTYPHAELVELLTKACELTKVPPPEMLRGFGTHLLGVFRRKFPEFFTVHVGPLEFLESVDNYVHVEVFKLYPDAELPRFWCQRLSERRLLLDYQSSRHLDDLALGLIEETLRSFGRQGSVQKSAISLNGIASTRFDIQLAT